MKYRSDRAVTWFVGTSAALLILTGLAKLLSVVLTVGSDRQIFDMKDPLVGMRFGLLFGLVGAVELAVAAVCLTIKRGPLALGLIAFLATDFVVYRAGLWFIDYQKPCTCLGTLTGALHIPPAMADRAMQLVLAYLLSGSYVLLMLHNKAPEATSAVNENSGAIS
ncbi:MAG: hypothetical protein NTV51_11130 [Verrucomicrobia bacterium]|nr:hypothetical protein [Verrucomicrobiota bacterium]